MEELPREAWGQFRDWSSSAKARTGRRESWEVRSEHQGKKWVPEPESTGGFHFLGFLRQKLRTPEEPCTDLVTVLEERGWVTSIRYGKAQGSKFQ